MDREVRDVVRESEDVFVVKWIEDGEERIDRCSKTNLKFAIDNVPNEVDRINEAAKLAQFKLDAIAAKEAK